MRFEGRRALVTGATSGLGEAIATRLASEGARVAITGRNEAKLRALASRQACFHPIVADHGQPDDNTRAVVEAVGTLGGLDLLVLNAGIFGLDSLSAPNPTLFRELNRINVVANYELLVAATPHLVSAAEAGIDASAVLLSSIAGNKPAAGVFSYSVSKAAVNMLVQAAAIELAPKRVRVNGLCPGVVVTELHKRGGLDEAAYEAFLERCRTTHPLGRPGQPEEIAALTAFLLSPEASWITGALLPIDGGRHLTSLR